MNVDVFARFLRRLLDLASVERRQPLIEAATSIALEVTQARIAYVELYDEHDIPEHSYGAHCSSEELGEIRSRISQGIIGRAVSAGRTIVTPSAIDDRRFRDLGSVKQHEIQAVLCAPIGIDDACGVLYLQRPLAFSDSEREWTELIARQVFGLVRQHPGYRDHDAVESLAEGTQRLIVEAWMRNDGNVARTARELGISRDRVYRTLRAKRLWSEAT